MSGNNNFISIQEISESIVGKYGFPNNVKKLWKYL